VRPTAWKAAQGTIEKWDTFSDSGLPFKKSLIDWGGFHEALLHDLTKGTTEERWEGNVLCSNDDLQWLRDLTLGPMQLSVRSVIRSNRPAFIRWAIRAIAVLEFSTVEDLFR
jgi:hypothetical protein